MLNTCQSSQCYFQNKIQVPTIKPYLVNVLADGKFLVTIGIPIKQIKVRWKLTAGFLPVNDYEINVEAYNKPKLE